MRKLGREWPKVAAQCGQSCGPPKQKAHEGLVGVPVCHSGDRGHTQTWESSVCGPYLQPCLWAWSLVDRVLGEKEGC